MSKYEKRVLVIRLLDVDPLTGLTGEMVLRLPVNIIHGTSWEAIERMGDKVAGHLGGTYLHDEDPEQD